MAAPLMALHVTPHRERLPAASVGAPEGLLARVAVRMDAQAGGPRESLVASAADVPVMVLLVGSRVGRREIMVMLPGRSHGRDHLLVSCCGRGCCSWSGRCGSGNGGCSSSSSSSSRRSSHGGRSLVVHSAGSGGRGSSNGSRNRRFNRRRVRSHAGSGRSVGARLRRTLAGNGGAIRSKRDLRLLVEVALVAGDRRSRRRVAACAVEAGSRTQRRSGRQADRHASHDRLIGARLRTRVRRADSLALCGYFISYLFIPSDACDKRWTYWLAERRHCQRPERGSRWKAESIWAGPQPEAREAAGESESRTQAPQ